MKGKVKIIQPGFFSTIQDEGRFGFSKYGVPRSGAMDKISYRLANSLLGNKENSACIEWALVPPELHFYEPTSIVLTGSEIDAFLNDKKIQMYHQIKVNKGDIFTASICKNKVYGYVGIKNGFLSKNVLNSRSFYKSITDQSKLNTLDEIAYQSNDLYSNQFSSFSSPFSSASDLRIEVYKGPEFDLLNTDSKTKLLNSDFTISKSLNRMAIQLVEKLPNDIPPILSSPVLPGTVQLTPSGTLIVLMRDCQTTGGYPRIFQLTESAINTIAQKRVGETFNFTLIE